jgi:transposase-like protein
LDAEMAKHLGHEMHGSSATSGGTLRYRRSCKTIQAEFGELPVETPGSRRGCFGPEVIAKRETHWAALDA